MRSGITRRWLRGNLLITVLLVLLVEVMFLYSATRSYYNGVQQTMYRRFSSITGQLKMYTGETSQKTAASRSVALRRWWSSSPIRTNMSSCCWTATAVSSPRPAAPMPRHRHPHRF